MGFVDGLYVSHPGVDTEGCGAVDTGDGDTVAGLYFVHQVVVSKYDDCVRGLTGRHILWERQINTWG